MGDRESNPLRGDLHTMLEPALIEIGTSAIESVPLISTGRGAGSGVVWSDDGLIVTNNHVALSPTVRASFASGDSYGARVIARNPALDLALLKATTESIHSSLVEHPSRFQRPWSPRLWNAPSLALPAGHVP